MALTEEIRDSSDKMPCPYALVLLTTVLDFD
jgi:hypothetical protein